MRQTILDLLVHRQEYEGIPENEYSPFVYKDNLQEGIVLSVLNLTMSSTGATAAILIDLRTSLEYSADHYQAGVLICRDIQELNYKRGDWYISKVFVTRFDNYLNLVVRGMTESKIEITAASIEFIVGRVQSIGECQANIDSRDVLTPFMWTTPQWHSIIDIQKINIIHAKHF